VIAVDPGRHRHERMHASGESATTIATALGDSKATIYRVLAEVSDDAD
jgi:hypothetical protein